MTKPYSKSVTQEIQDRCYELYQTGYKVIEIAKILSIPYSTAVTRIKAVEERQYSENYLKQVAIFVPPPKRDRRKDKHGHILAPNAQNHPLQAKGRFDQTEEGRAVIERLNAGYKPNSPGNAPLHSSFTGRLDHGADFLTLEDLRGAQ